MDWLDLSLPPQTAFQMERQRRELQCCEDLEILRAMAVAMLQEAHQQSNVARQLASQVARLEAQLAQAGAFPSPDANHLQWARKLRQELLGQAE